MQIFNLLKNKVAQNWPAHLYCNNKNITVIIKVAICFQPADLSIYILRHLFFSFKTKLHLSEKPLISYIFTQKMSRVRFSTPTSIGILMYYDV